MNLFRRSIRPAIAVGSAAIPFLKELLVLTFELVVEDDATDARALFAQALGLLKVRAIDVRVVHQLARPVYGETGVACASDAGVELLPSFWLLGSAAFIANITPVAKFLLHARQSQYVALHVGPAVAFEHVSSSLGQHDQRAVVADGRDGLDEPRVSEAPQVTPVRVEQPVLTVAKIAGGHDTEGADGCERADLRAAQPHVAVACPDALAFRASRQLEVAREHVANVEPFTFARIAQPAAAASAQLTIAIIAITWVISPTRIEIHIRLLPDVLV